jgi:glycerol dehydrogenase
MSRIFASPARYIQEAGAIGELGRLTMQHGSSTLLVVDSEVWAAIGDSVRSSFGDVTGTFQRAQFAGECTLDEIDRLTAIARESDVDVVVGAGGGKAIDTAKSVSRRVGAPLGSVPTVASTDSPTSSLSVIYEADGTFAEAETHGVHPEFVLVDTRVVARAPTRWFVSGIGDALATWYEARATWESGGTTVFEGRPTYAGRALAAESHRLLREHAEAAVDAVETGTVTEAVEAVTEAIILLSGLGFENGGLAAAHAIHDGLTTLPAASGATHGEKVTVGLLAQLILEDASDDLILDLVSFADAVGLPACLEDIGVTAPTREDLLQVGRIACAASGPMANEPTDVSPADVAAALSALDSLGA